jgi:hypothetical protein
MKACRFEVLPRIFEEHGRACGWHSWRPQQAIDVVHPESDAFHVKRGDCARQGFALGDDRGKRRIFARLQKSAQLSDAFLGGHTVVDGHG